MPESTQHIYFPIETGDQAQLHDPRSLLAQEVYAHIAKYLRSALDRAATLLPRDTHNYAVFDRHRSHEAILLDGGRGTGKSSVLVNLPLYLDSLPELKQGLLILKPVDPTLLENGDDLFLNVIVAALMRDPLVRQALKAGDPGTKEFYDELQALGSALEGIQKISKEYGLDKLRAFVENQELAEHVHRLFRSALLLTKKQLIVLPIDDVDTSLQLAFENVEVVRKYLTSPFVLPLISGDLRLYDDVIYRQFAQRLLGETRIDRPGALARARGLAEEYERKVFPLPRRIRLPSLSSYLNDPKIHLADGEEKLIALPLFKNWIDAMFNDRVNGEENSFREIPLRTVREFAQFVHASRELLPDLQRFFRRNHIGVNGAEPPIMLRRKLLMSPKTADAVRVFGLDFEAAFSIRRDETRTQRTARDHAYRLLRQNVEKVRKGPDPETIDQRIVWSDALAHYAFHQRNWGSTFLVADANVHLLSAEADVLGHDLFRPQRHEAPEYAHFDEAVQFGQVWQDLLGRRAPEQWLARLPRTTLLSYPGPESGRVIRRDKPTPEDGANFALQLGWKMLVHWSYYSATGRGDLLLCGRMFELLVTSLTCDLTRADVHRILNRPPFYSLAAFASTKTLQLEEMVDEEPRSWEPDGANAGEDEDLAFESGLAELIDDINRWRRRVQITRPSAWFIFVVMNKFFSQVQYINGGSGTATAPDDIVSVAVQCFNLFWSTVGSFEKGEVFGLPQIVATMNMPPKLRNFDYHPLYKQNIGPFLQLREKEGYFDFGTGSYTYALESHPLRSVWNLLAARMLDDELARAAAARQAPPETAETLEAIDRRIDRYVNEVRRNFDLSLTIEGIERAPLAELRRLVDAIKERCRRDPATLARFLEIASTEDDDLPKNSGRRRLQRIMQRLRS
jgi:hypothetical protein